MSEHENRFIVKANLKLATSGAALWLAGSALSACSSSGGSGGASTPALTLTPASLTLEVDPGVATPVSINARPNFTTSGPLYVIVRDDHGVITPDLALTFLDGSYDATFTTSPTLTKGRHTGALAVHLCPVANCSENFAGSPVALPYDITVGTTPTLTPLSPLAGATDWQTYQLDAAHTGHVPATTEAAAFSTRWRWLAPGNEAVVTAPAIAAGVVYFSVSSRFGGISKLFALDEVDSTTRWVNEMGSVFALNPPALSGGAVFAATSGNPEETAMWSFDAATGTPRFHTPFGSQGNRYYAPTIVDNGVYTNGGTYGGMLRFNATTGAQDWFSGSLAQFDQWTPAVDGTQAYAITADTITALNRESGRTVWKTTLDISSSFTYSSYRTPVLDGDGAVLARSDVINGFSESNSLTRLATVDGSKIWVVSGGFATDPVLAGDVVYIANQLQLEARSRATGEQLWHWAVSDASETGFIGNLVVSNNMLFLSTNRRTHAIDLASHTSVWHYGKPGHKAISAQGVLYIATTDSTGVSDRGLTAINLH